MISRTCPSSGCAPPGPRSARRLPPVLSSPSAFTAYTTSPASTSAAPPRTVEYEYDCPIVDEEKEEEIAIAGDADAGRAG
jgi:hypothetical protein